MDILYIPIVYPYIHTHTHIYIYLYIYTHINTQTWLSIKRIPKFSGFFNRRATDTETGILFTYICKYIYTYMHIV